MRSTSHDPNTSESKEPGCLPELSKQGRASHITERMASSPCFNGSNTPCHGQEGPGGQHDSGDEVEAEPYPAQIASAGLGGNATLSWMAMDSRDPAVSMMAEMKSRRNPIQRAVESEANHQAPFASRAPTKASRKRGPAPYARIVGRPCCHTRHVALLQLLHTCMA